jgi:hypothetical protein
VCAVDGSDTRYPHIRLTAYVEAWIRSYEPVGTTEGNNFDSISRFRRKPVKIHIEPSVIADTFRSSEHSARCRSGLIPTSGPDLSVMNTNGKFRQNGSTRKYAERQRNR